MAFKKKQENIKSNKNTVFKQAHKNVTKPNTNKNSKIKFDDEGNTLAAFDDNKKRHNLHKSQNKNHDDLGDKWYEEVCYTIYIL